MGNWIKFNRKIKNHWITENAEYFKAWFLMIAEVNWKDGKTLIKGQLVDCKRGQSILSLNSWVKYLGRFWTISKLKTFFNLLEKDSMINQEGLKYTTKLTICKYNTYQGTQLTDSELITNSTLTDDFLLTTIEEVKEDCKKLKEDIIYTLWISLPNLINHKILDNGMKINIKTVLKEYSEQDIKKAIENYNIVLGDGKYYYNYKHSLEDFLRKGTIKPAPFKKFLDEMKPLTALLDFKYKGDPNNPNISTAEEIALGLTQEKKDMGFHLSSDGKLRRYV